MSRPFVGCQAFFAWRDELVLCIRAEIRPALGAPAKSISVTESDSFDHVVVADQCAVRLFAGVLAKAIARVHSKFDQPAINVLTIFPKVRRLGIALPFNFRTVGIEQHALQPIPDNFLVIFWIRPAKSRLNRLREDTGGENANQEEGNLHSSSKRKMMESSTKKSRSRVDCA
jgi:hypothetical protein